MLDTKTNHRVHPYTATIGMWLFLAALAMLFGATIIGYVVIRNTSTLRPPPGTIHLPAMLLLSTAFILAGSITIHLAIYSIQHERQQMLRRYLLLTCLLAGGFVAVQIPAMAMLLSQHRAFRAGGLHLYGLIFFLILIHALHVVGGIIGLALTTRHAHQNRYDHESYAGVKHAAMYWHFLDVVWIVMYVGLWISR